MNTVKAAKIKGHKCPECGSGAVRRSQMRGILERGVYRVIGMRAYRCEACDYRYLQFKRTEVKSS